ncbi:rRNA-processing protein cgrA [Rhizoctonia solani]|uniref:rRNA-processing protein n=2 Tax=Rhizoctonia solani TaxID=456999 RepID=A0A8H7LKI7_9AGAM|nr:rRNA-processing protein cgrA [Rhizoctonia solani]
MTTPVIPMSPAQPVEAATHTEEADFVPLAQTSNGRASGKGWKSQKTATKRSHMQAGVRAKSWEARMRKTAAETAVKRLHKEMIEEKAAEAASRRREVSQERKRVRAEKARLEELAAKMSAKKAERLRKRAGRSKKVNG